MSLLDSVLDLGVGNIAVGVVSGILLFSVFFKDRADFMESVGGFVGASDWVDDDRRRDSHGAYLKFLLWAGLSLLMMFASAAFFDPYPKKLEFAGESLSVREDNNDTLMNIEVLTYRNYDNSAALTIAIPGNEDVTVEDFRKQYLRKFQDQGIRFSNRGGRYIGVKGNTYLYMSEPYSMSALLIFTKQEDRNAKMSFSNTRDKFVALEEFDF